ncbi:MAG TPA: DUF885 domain-containing protein [Thermoanaerobaculia bacterium]|nr:DUF885 domain-containing protein [Thermoanaerobaculia bacterium]
MKLPSILVCLLLAAASGLAAQTAAQTSPGAESARLHDLFRREWETQLRENPVYATIVGRHDYDDRLPAMGRADLERRNGLWKGFLEELKRIDRSKLPAEDVVSAEIFESELEDRIADYELGGWQMPFNADSGFHSDFAFLAAQTTFRSVKDYDNYIRRLRQWPRYMNEQIELMRVGLGRGMTVPRAVLDGYDATISAHLVEDPEQSVFYGPFRDLAQNLPALPAAERQRLEREGRQVVTEAMVPGYRTFLDFYQKEYLPKARTTLGASELPEGRAFYAQQIRHFTTLDLTPEEIHRTGLAEVERIDREMKEVIRQTGFQGDFAAFLQHLRTDRRFYPENGEALLKQAAWIAKRMDGKLPALFGRLPRLPYTVEPVPDHIAPKYTSGRYFEPPQGGTQPGTYWVNVYKPETRPLYNLEALTLHEAVPGHHLQISLARELEGLPEFRRFLYISAFGEGWGLYSEWLGLEAGFYTDPYSNFGRLTYEMWRACRLVVDTGLHAMGWTRQQALDYMASHTALPLHEVETETDRYISWPGQALAYKMGELKIKELRRRAEKELGPRFDVRAFHDAVLGSGSIPLGVLEMNVDRWITRVKGEGAGR